jgi:hypothetical protein
MPLISLANPLDLDYAWTMLACGGCSLLAAISTGISLFCSNRRGSQIHPHVAPAAWVLVPVPVVDDQLLADTSYTRYSIFSDVRGSLSPQMTGVSSWSHSVTSKSVLAG